MDAKGILQLFDDDSLLKTLHGKEWWRFEEADKMRNLMSSDEVMGWWRTQSIREKLSKEMEIASEKNGMEDTWRFYSAAKHWRRWSGFEVPSKSSFHRMQRIINRHNPEAMLRELRLYQFEGLKELKEMGFDSGITEKELDAADKLMRRERGKLGKVFDKEVEAAQLVVAQNAEIASELTNWEVDKARGMGFLQRAFRYSGGGGDPCR